MEISGTSGLSAVLSQAQSGDAVATQMLKKTMDIQAQTATQLIEALPQPSNPPHLGNSVDTKA